MNEKDGNSLGLCCLYYEYILGSRGYFFLIDTDRSRRSRVNEARNAERKREPYQTVSTVYLTLGILRPDPWSQGTMNRPLLAKHEKA